jgi:membrane-associated phospholipid phosphatase
MRGWLPGDERLVLWAHRHAVESRFGPRLSQLETAVPYGSATVLYCLLAWLALEWPESRGAALRAMVAGVVAWVASDVVKALVARPRPCLHEFACSSGSFPEGPGTVLVALAVAIWPTSRTIALLAAACALADAAVQLAYGDHWPSDMLGAWILGGLCGFAVPRLAVRFMRIGE